MQTATLFQHEPGQGQAVRLPHECQFHRAGKEIYMKRAGWGNAWCCSPWISPGSPC